MTMSLHVFHYRCPMDGVEQPYLVAAPDGATFDRPLPAIIVLHDVLVPATVDGFVDHAQQLLAPIVEAVKAGEPALVIVPFGRGNAGWIGWGETDLDHVLGAVGERFRMDATRVSLLGTGMGATGALLLAGRRPDQFSAVAASGAWTSHCDHDLLVPPARPDWQKPQLRQLSPLYYAGALAHLPVRLEHPWWRLGVNGSASRHHTQRLADHLRSRGCDCEVHIQDAPVDARRDWFHDVASIVGWLLAQHKSTPTNWELRAAPSERVDAYGVGVVTTDRDGRVRVQRQRDRLSISTRRVRFVTLNPQVLGSRTLVIDDQPVDATAAEGLVAENVQGRWLATSFVKPASARFSGIDLRQRALIFVYGSLGDETANLTMQQCARLLSQRWQSGEDSVNLHPGDRRPAMDFPVKQDAQITDEDFSNHNMVVIGCPKSNLVLARLRAELPVTWGSNSLTVNGVEYCGDVSVAAVCGTSETRALLVLSGTSPPAWIRACGVPTALLPGYLVFRGNRVLDWGFRDGS